MDASLFKKKGRFSLKEERKVKNLAFLVGNTMLPLNNKQGASSKKRFFPSLRSLEQQARSDMCILFYIATRMFNYFTKAKIIFNIGAPPPASS
jgi:hypothetical protein